MESSLSNNKQSSDEHTVDQKILCTQLLLDNLRLKGANITTEIDTCVALAPLMKLPNEILIEIFLFCIPNGISIPSDFFYAQNLSLVCLKWRRIIQQITSLWSTISISCDEAHNLVRYFKMARWLLSHSGDSLISVKLRGCSDCHLNYLGSPHPIISLVTSFAGRMKYLSLGFVSSLTLQHFFSLPPGLFTSLQTLDIQCGNNVSPSMQGSSTLHDLRNLRVFSFRPIGHRVIFTPRVFNPPWAYLSELHLPASLMRPDIAHELLRECNNLVSCTLALRRDNVGPHDPPRHNPSTLLPKLKSLIIICCLDFSHFLPSLVTPNLVHLEFGSRIADGPRLKPLMSGWEPWDAIVPFAGQCHKIEKFISHWAIPSHVIEALLPEVPSLIQLSLHRGDPFSDEVLMKISQGNLVPALEEIDYCVKSLKSVFNALESRWSRSIMGESPCSTAIRRATVLNLGHDIRLDTESENHRQYLLKEGMDITVTVLDEYTI